MFLKKFERFINQYTVAIALLLVLSFTLLRLISGEGNFSWFVVAGSDFVDNSYYSQLHIEKGQGYDGQFFYRYAHDPFDFSKTNYGVTVDHPEYRSQRIMYPLLSWIFSLGGNPSLVPVSLVLVNIFSLFGIFLFFRRWVQGMLLPNFYAFGSFFVFGLWMSLARDLAEILEVFFFIGALYSAYKKNLLGFAILSLLAMFTRDTSSIALLMVGGLLFLQRVKERLSFLHFLRNGFTIGLPFILLLLWKLFIRNSVDSDGFVDGSQNLSFPFIGILFGAKSNFNWNGGKQILETLFWFGYFFWNILLTFLVVKRVEWKKLLNLSFTSNLQITYLIWGLFALVLGPAIYVDDWGYVRIFSLWNALGLLLLILSKRNLNFMFWGSSTTLLVLTLIRLIVRI